MLLTLTLTLTLLLPCNYTEAYRSLWVGYAWTTETLFFIISAVTVEIEKVGTVA